MTSSLSRTCSGPVRLRLRAPGRSLVRTTERVGSLGLRLHPAAEFLKWAISTLAVGAALAATWWLSERFRPGPEGMAAPPPAVMVELAPEILAPEVEEAGTDLAAPSADQAEQADSPDADRPEEEGAPEPDPALPPPEEPLPDPVEEVPLPDEAPEPPPEERPEETIEEAPDEILPEPDFPPEPEPDPVDPLPANDAPVVALRPPSRPEDLREPPPPQPARQQPAPSTPSAPSVQSAPRPVEAPAAPVATAPQNVVTETAPQISPQQWQSQVLSHLDRFKRYPDAARAAREQGSPQVRITINAAGQVLGVSLAASSGFPLLDQAAIEMAQRASPLPAPPASVTQSQISLTVPVNFRLR